MFGWYLYYSRLQFQMAAIARSSCEFSHESDSFLLPVSEKSPSFQNNERAVYKRLPWEIIFPWMLSGVLLVGILFEFQILGNRSDGYWSYNELGLLLPHSKCSETYP
jgi:hypothetical protein